MRKIKENHIEDIARGAAFLGAGGGGDPEFDALRTSALMERFGEVTLLDIEALADDDLVVPLAWIGAPLVALEKLASGNEAKALLSEVERYYGKKPKAVVACEIGGSNAFCAMQAALENGLYLLDADTIGRAFPKLEMSSCHLFGICPSPAFITDSLGTTLCLHSKSAYEVERYFRILCEEMGSSALLALYIMNGKEAKKALIRGSVTHAMELGARLKRKERPFSIMATGVISSIEQALEGGFLKGVIEVRGDGRFTIEYQNEYLVVKTGDTYVATTPDIIALICAETGIALPVERVKFGLAVHIVILPAPAIWTTQQALELVGPKAFGYKEDI